MTHDTTFFMSRVRDLAPPVASFCALLVLAACEAQPPAPTLVESHEQALAIYSKLDEPEKLRPHDIDICWVHDTDRDEMLTSDDAYAAEQARIRALFEEWTPGTALDLRWSDTCPGPVGGSYAAQEMRVYVDAPPLETEARKLPGTYCDARCTFPAAGNSWAEMPGELCDTRCSVNIVVRAGFNAASVLHELGHSLGLIHEQERRDAPAVCHHLDGRYRVSSDPQPPGPNIPSVFEPFIVHTKAMPDPDGDVDDSAARVTSIVFDIDIDHPQPSNLEVRLTAPNGRVATLHAFGDASPVQRRYSGSEGNLASLLDSASRASPVLGDWTVTIVDFSFVRQGTLRSWGLLVNQQRVGPLDAIYATGYSMSTVMHYTIPECSAQGNATLAGLSDHDHLVAEMVYPSGETPVLGGGVYRDDQAIDVRSGWVERGALAAIGTDAALNYAFITDMWLSVVQGISTRERARSTRLTAGPLPVGDYFAHAQVFDWWGREAEGMADIRVIPKSEHTALVMAVLP